MDFENHETFFDVWHRILFVSFHACIMLFLFDDAVVILLARLYGMRMCRSITQSQGSYSHQTFWKIPILTSVRDNKLCLKALSCIYIRDIGAWQPSIYHGWLLRQNPHVKYAMLEKTQLFRIFDNVSSKCLGLVVKETVCP